EVIATGLVGLDNLAFDSRDQLYVSNADDGSIHKVLASGQTRLVSGGGMIWPGGLAMVPDSHAGESVFVGDLWGLREFDGLTGKAENVELSFLTLPGSIIAPMTVSADGENLILSSWLSDSVQLWNPQTGIGTTVKDYSGSPVIPLNAIKFGDEIVIADFNPISFGRVIRASDSSPIVSGLAVPMGLAPIGDDLYVADWFLGMVFRIVTDGVPTFVPVATGLSGPEGLAVDLDGNLLVVEGGAGRLSRIDVETGTVSTIVEGLEIGIVLPTVPMGQFNGVAVGPTGYIYVTGDMANVLYRLKPSN
ncbi:MAG TPA: hypothetical protein VK253_00745, partial [Candidatus Binatia bacterium]|nr:hypothetical protein [Candidatus Binatia bacterium]